MKMTLSSSNLLVCTFFAVTTLAGCTSNGAIAQMPPANTPPIIDKATARGTQSFAKIETSFQIPNLEGDPFDFEKNDVRAEIRLPNGKTLSLPAFFDGNNVWRVRHTPVARGKHEVVQVTRNGEKLQVTTTPSTWDVEGEAQPGFLRIDAKNPRRFSFDNGARYYPLGANAAWTGGGQTEYPQLFERFHAAGQNWSRIWMNHWDGKNLDWPKVGDLGQLDLKVAQRWDMVVESAVKNGIYFQPVFQHHGQYSSKVNPNWDENPYNVKLGGFLNSPEEFFTNERARALTKRKMRYFLARYGYCPQIMAWELWNEVQFSDAAQNKNWDVVAKWHREMADFIRSQDVYGHLITTSSEVPAEVFEPVDYYQRHAYPTNLITDLSRPRFGGKEWAVKPYFTGEYGSDHTGDRPDEWTMHSGLWAGLFSDAAGAAQYWYTDKTDGNNWYHHFASATAFLKASGFTQQDGKAVVAPTQIKVETPQRGELFLSPGGDWGKAEKSDFDLSTPEGAATFGEVPRYFQGKNHRDLNPVPLTLKFSSPQAGQLQIRLAQVAKAGANLRVTVNGKTQEFPFPETAQDSSEARTLAVPIGTGAQMVSLENTGQDWVVIRDLVIPGASMLLGGYAKTSPDFAMAWFYHFKNIESAKPEGSSSGSTILGGLGAGDYQVTWWDTLGGKALKTEKVNVGAGGLKLSIPPVSRDVAVWAVKEG